jgi:hypothetical protein
MVGSRSRSKQREMVEVMRVGDEVEVEERNVVERKS